MELKEKLINEIEISIAIENIAKDINKIYSQNTEVIFIVVLKGGIIFASDLMRKLNFPIRLDFILASSYGNSTKSSGIVKIIKDVDVSIEGRDVLLIEDIVDTGLTLSYLKRLLLNRKPKSLKICTLLDKPSRRKTKLTIDFIGIKIPDSFVVGFGLDWNEKYRQLPYIGILGNKES